MRRAPTPRLLLGVACALFLLVPAPAPLSVAGVVTLAGAAAAVWAVRHPGGLGTLSVLAAGVLVWLVDVADPGLLHAVAFGAAGYAVHTLAALAAGIPPGVPLDGACWRAVAGRAAVAVVVSLAAVVAAGRSAPPASALLVGAALLLCAAAATIPRTVSRWSNRQREYL